MDIDEAFDVLQRIQDTLDIPEEILFGMDQEEFEITLTIFFDSRASNAQFEVLDEAREEFAEE